MGFPGFLSKVFNTSDSSTHPSYILASNDDIVSNDTGSRFHITTDDTWSPNANNAFRTNAGEWQCASDSYSAARTFWVATDTEP